jgi:hypothetical protein
LGLILLLTIVIHWHFDPDYYKSVLITVNNGSVNFLEGNTATSNQVPHLPGNAGKTVYLNNLHPFSIYFICLQILGTLVLGYLIVQELIRILRAVQKARPFIHANVTSFRRLGYLCLSIIVLNSLHFLRTDQTSFISFSINYTLLIFMLIAFILAEVFSEGQKLYEQEKLTI